MLYHFLDVDISKSSSVQVSNWERPTLTRRQVRYAADDVVYLPILYQKLAIELKRARLARLAMSCFRNIPTQVELEVCGYYGIYEY